MSSYTINKEEYIKAAGVVAGIASSVRDFWVFDYEAGRNSTAEDYYNRFAECYRMNAESVAEQYGDPEPETDPNEYRAEFREYMRIGRQAQLRGRLKDIMLELRDFFRSALYQTEHEAYNQKMELFFYRVLDQIMDSAFPRECNSWGRLDIA